MAAHFGRLDIVKFLCMHCLDVNTTDKNGNTALIFAAESGNADVVRHFLFTYGANPFIKNTKGKTASAMAKADNPGVRQALDLGTNQFSGSVQFPNASLQRANIGVSPAGVVWTLLVKKKKSSTPSHQRNYIIYKKK